MHRVTYVRRVEGAAFRLVADGGDDALARLFHGRGAVFSFKKNKMIAAEGTPIDRVYRIETGYVRCCSYTEDGLRQIFAFAGPGDLLGFPDLDLWHFTAEAVGPVTTRALQPKTLDNALVDEKAVAKALRRLCVDQFERRERHLIWLSHLQSEDRLLAFLTEFASTGDDFVAIPMTRQDLGDHLGMTLETVSRCFGSLRRRGAIAMQGANRYRLLGAKTRASAA